ncbi:TonB-dependent receptor [Sphingomonas piscis]|uniref:TonB-dependent receptor n=1 Tax=Sphingomonas piscis TaxID=2714943 RepID=A0A6G7YMT3_9SPHN|nr:TonB-dependent receptor [Sphingomonas piscis]QIK78050.1 TonB-dependent receptor [Sphingomonas piscis]
MGPSLVGSRVLLATSALPFAVAPSIAHAQDTTTADAAQSDGTAPEAPTGAPDSSATDDDNATAGDNSGAIVVTGFRRALETAKNIKRNSDTFVDSITASDVATLPDLSVAEALGRIPGLTVSRFPTGGASPDFPSPEGRGNLIRGLGYTRSEFNGRDAFSANGGRALDWSSIPPELVGAVDVFKNQTADLIEGGIGGTINLRTLEPFDRKGRVIAIAVDGTYSDLRKKWAPSGSITLGDRWQTGAGEFGLMASYSRSKLDSRIHGWQQSAPTPRVLVGGNLPSTGFTGAGRINEFAGVDPSQIIGATTGFQMRTNDVDRDRTSYYGAAQWKNDRIKATLKYVNVRNDIDSVERTYEWWPDHDPGATMSVSNLVVRPWSTEGTALCNGAGGFPSNPGDCETLIPIQGGLMESGLVSNTNDSWTGVYGNAIGSLGIGKQERTKTRDLSANVQWDVTDRMTVSLDAHRTRSSAKFMELWGGLNSWANHQIDHDLDNPTIAFTIDPRNQFNSGNTRYPGDDAGTPIPHPTSLADLNGANWQFAADRWQVGTGKLYAVRGDVNYDLSGGDGATSWFKDVKFGARYARRSQRNAEMGLNWGAIAPAWAGGYGIVGTFQNPEQAAEGIDFSNFFRGGVVQGDNTVFPFVNEDLLTNYSAFRQFLLNEPQIGTNHLWVPRGSDDGSRFGSPNFNPQDISDITEKTKNLYARFDFGNEFDNGMSLDGNIGIRYSKTELASTGFRAYRPLNPDTEQPEFAADGVTRLRTPDAEDRDDLVDFVPEAAIYAAQAPLATDFKSSDTKWLPSFNLKWNLNREMLFRVGVSKGLSRPNVQDLRGSQEYVVTASRENYAPITDENDPLFGVDRGAANITVNEIRVSRGNPQLKPTTAWNYDLSYEYYFKNGYVSAAAFLKKIRNVQVNGELSLGTDTIAGQEVPVIYSGPINQSKATVKGFELAYQQTYDFLPGFFGHLGLQANYTMILAKSTPPANTGDSDGDGIPDEGQTGVYRFGVDDMLGQSKHIANVVGFYQDDKWEARLAYNWRSKYLTTYRDYVTGFPVYNSASGNLDASLKYQIIQPLQVRASIANILDTKSKARVQIDQNGTMYDRFSFLNDRRIVIGLLAQF